MSADSPQKMVGRTIRIRTAEVPSGQAAKGQDTFVSLVLEDGREVALPQCIWALWRVDARTGYCTAVVGFRAIEIDAQALVGSADEHALAMVDVLTRRVKELEGEVKTWQELASGDGVSGD